MTTDKTNQLYSWDLESEQPACILTSDHIKNAIADVAAIEILKLVAVASMDKLITLWDVSSKRIMLEIQLSNAGAHSIVYVPMFQTLITAGYENVICLWEVNTDYLDYSLTGRLVGHSSMIAAVQIIQKTPMIVSSDDIGHIKVWDIRNFSCLQTIEMGSKTIITKIIDMYSCGKIGFLGSRVSIMEFEDTHDIKNKLLKKEAQWPIQVDYNLNLNEVIVCTKKDVRFIDAATGRVKKIYADLLYNKEDDITVFRLIQQNKRFVLGDQHGKLGLYLYSTGECLKYLNGHSNEITSLGIDYINNLIISAGWDSQVVIQKETKTSFQTKRTITNAHHSKAISVLEVSVYHNLFITGSLNSTLYIWDYEYSRLIGSLEIEPQAEPTAVQFVNGLEVVIVCTTIGTVHFFHLARRGQSILDIRYVAKIELTIDTVDELEQTKNADHASDRFNSARRSLFCTSFNTTSDAATKIQVDIDWDLDDENKKLTQAKVFLGLSKGGVRVYDALKLLNQDPEIMFVPHSNTRPNYNAERNAKEDFEDSINQLQTPRLHSNGAP